MKCARLCMLQAVASKAFILATQGLAFVIMLEERGRGETEAVI